MTPMLLEGPAAEPVTLDEMKAYLRLDGAEEDGLVASLLSAARLLVEAHAGCITTHRTWRLVLDAWPPGGIVRVPLSPLAAIAGARLIDADGEAQELEPDALAVDGVADPPRILASPGLPKPGAAFNGIEIDVIAGYGPAPSDVPETLREAIRALAARWFEQRGEASRTDAPRLPADVAALLSAHRRVRL